MWTNFHSFQSRWFRTHLEDRRRSDFIVCPRANSTKSQYSHNNLIIFTINSPFTNPSTADIPQCRIYSPLSLFYHIFIFISLIITYQTCISIIHLQTGMSSFTLSLSLFLINTPFSNCCHRYLSSVLLVVVF